MSATLIMLIGFAAQGCFSARVLVQWAMSERARRVLSPLAFWLLSLAGSCLFVVYGWLRDDFSIILGQAVTYYIYIWNVRHKGFRLPLLLHWALVALPVAVAAVVMARGGVGEMFFRKEGLPLWLVAYGSTGQLLFSLRFVWQWLYSRRRGESVLPRGFWIISITGAAMILSYGVMRSDIVLIVGQAFGLVAYSRNLFLYARQ